MAINPEVDARYVFEINVNGEDRKFLFYKKGSAKQGFSALTELRQKDK